MSRSSSGIVAGLTAAALAAVGFLAFQASANVPDNLSKPRGSASDSPSKPGPDKKKPKTSRTAVPAQSGTGLRVVYSVSADHVWLVEENNKARASFDVTPSTVDPLPGQYAVTSRSGSITGSDGVAIEHVVRFATVEGVSIGFSAAVDGSMPEPNPEERTGGIRSTREDGTAMWKFAAVGVQVVVVA